MKLDNISTEIQEIVFYVESMPSPFPALYGELRGKDERQGGHVPKGWSIHFWNPKEEILGRF